MVWRLSQLLSPHQLLRRFYCIGPEQVIDAGLVVSAGGDTLAPNVAAARISNAPNIFYGSLRRYPAQDFTLVLTSYERDVRTPNAAMTLKPSAADPDSVPATPASPLGGHACGLLVGGNSGTFTYTDRDWNRLIAFLEQDHATMRRHWLVSNSPRTPEAVSDRLAALAREPKGPIAEFIDVRSKGTGTLAQIFTRVSNVLCTGDSSSMLSESVWMRKPVIAVLPEYWTLPDFELNYRAYLESKGWARSLSIASLTPEACQAEFAAITPLTANPLDDLASLILSRIRL
jgi:hypothetical protein